MARTLICIGALAAGLVASGAQACDMHGDFGFDMYAYYADQAEREAMEVARQEAQDRAMTQARTAFLNRFDIKVDDVAFVPASYQPESGPSTDADRRSQSQASDR